MAFSFRSFVRVLLLNLSGLFLSHALVAQDFPAETLRQLDSLSRVVKSQNHDTMKVRALIAMADLYVMSNADTTLALCTRAMKISNRINYTQGKSACNNLFCYVLHERGNADSALYYMFENVKLDREQGDIKGAGADLNNIGAVYHQKGDVIKALHYYYQALALRERINDQKGILGSTFNIATLLYNQGEREKATAYYFRCLKIARLLKNNEFISKCITSIATIYRTKLSRLYESNASRDSIAAYQSKVLLYYNSALQHDKQNNFVRLYAADLNALGITYRYLFLYLKKNGASKDSLQDAFDKAIAYFNESLAISQKQSYRQLEAYNLQYTADLYLYSGDIPRAEDLALKSLKIAEEIRSPENLKHTSQTLYELYKRKGDYRKALDMHERYTVYRDSLANVETKKAGLKKQFEYEAERKDRENLLLVQKNEIQQLEISRKEYALYALICIVALVLIVSILFIRQSRIVNSQKTMKLEQRLLRSQMNPHFIFNSLIAIQSFIYKNEPKESGKYLSSFARLVRAILENSREEYITLSKEIQWLENYMNLQQLRFDNQFDYTVSLSEDLNPDTTRIPPMLIQPSIENALEHGLKSIDYQGLLEVEFKKENNCLVVLVKDNGIGISASAMGEEQAIGKHRSLATVIIRERLELLNRRKLRKISFTISPVEPKGTLITFSIPL